MPLSTVRMISGVPAKRKAHEATLLSGERCLSRPTMWSGTFDRRPPRSGSMMMPGMLALTSDSYSPLAFEPSQST